MWLFVLLLACRGPASDGCDEVAPADPCEGQVCVDVCGVPLARGDGPAVSGWEVVALPDPVTFEVLRVGDVLVSTDGITVRTYTADLQPLGMLGPLYAANDLAPAGDDAVLVGMYGALTVVDLTDPASPVARVAWHPATTLEGDRPGAYLVGAWRGRAVVSVGPSPALAIVDFGDPEQPIVEACLRDPGAEPARFPEASDEVVAWPMGEEFDGHVALFDPSSSDAPFARVPHRGPIALDRDRLLVWGIADDEREVVLYAIEGTTVTELGRRQGEGLQSNHRMNVAGGVVLSGVGHPEYGYAGGIDILDATLPLVRLEPLVDGHTACPLHLTDTSWNVLFDIAPGWFPDDRLSPDSGLDCPGEGDRSYPSAAVVSPDGTALVVTEGDARYLYRPADGSRTLVPAPYPAHAWIEGAYVVGRSGCDAEPGVHVLSEDGATDVWVDDRTPAWIAPDRAFAWVVSEATQLGCNSQNGDTDPATRVAWRVDANASVESIDLPDDARPDALLPAGDGLALVDREGRHRLLSRDGAVVGVAEGVPITEHANFAASARGVFTWDPERGTWWARPDEPPRQLTDACEAWLVAAEGPHVRWNRRVRPGPGFGSYEATELVDPATGEVVATLPAPTYEGRVLGTPGALLGAGVYLVDDPP